MQTVLHELLPDSYQSFASTLCLMMKGDPNALSFEELVSILLQEDQLRPNRNTMCVANQAFVANQRGSKDKAGFSSSKQKYANVEHSKKEYKDEKKGKK